LHPGPGLTQPSILKWSVNRVPACRAGVEAGCVRLCRMEGNTVWSHTASDTPYVRWISINSLHTPLPLQRKTEISASGIAMGIEVTWDVSDASFSVLQLYHTVRRTQYDRPSLRQLRSYKGVSYPPSISQRLQNNNQSINQSIIYLTK